MLDKFYVPIASLVAQQAAEFFQAEVQAKHIDLDRVTMNKMMTFCAEVILIAEHCNVEFTMTNTQAVWVYTWYDKSCAAMENNE